MSPITHKLPLTSQDITPEWIAAVREASGRAPIQAGHSIEAFSENRGMWLPVMLPNGAVSFATARDRDEVLRRVNTPKEK